MLVSEFGTIVAAFLLFTLAGLTGGPDFGGDVSVIHKFALERAADPQLTKIAIMVTHLGSAFVLLPVLFLAGLALAVTKRWRDLIAMTAIVLGGRITIEILKLAIGRPRPAFDEHPVEVHSLSFPSGHAGNTMMTFLAIALIVVPAKWRVVAVGVALLSSVAIGLTRPWLGVHWPSDVIGGWALGIGWVVALDASTRGWRGAAK